MNINSCFNFFYNHSLSFIKNNLPPSLPVQKRFEKIAIVSSFALSLLALAYLFYRIKRDTDAFIRRSENSIREMDKLSVDLEEIRIRTYSRKDVSSQEHKEELNRLFEGSKAKSIDDRDSIHEKIAYLRELNDSISQPPSHIPKSLKSSSEEHQEELDQLFKGAQKQS